MSDSYNYVVTAHRPTAVYGCVTGNFLSNDECNLVLNKLTRLDVFGITSDGLRLLKEVPICGRITILKSFRPEKSKKDLLFVFTQKNNAMVLEMGYDQHGAFQVETLASGVIREKPGRAAETGTQCSIDRTSSFLALRIYEGVINISKLDLKGKEIRSYNTRIEETGIIDFTFMSMTEMPTLCFIYQDGQARHLKTYKIQPDQELKRDTWKQDNIESESNFLIPVLEPHGGVIVIGQESVTHVLGDGNYTAITDPALNQSTVTCYCTIDSGRYVICDLLGRLFLLALMETSNTAGDGREGKKFSMTMFHLGWSSIAQCICYLDNYYFFIGSRLGDSQLVRINPEAAEGMCVETIDSYTSLAPILDMLVLDLDKQGQDQLVTCSGFQNDGSLRIIRNGIGINELANIDMAGIKGVWRMKLGTAGDHDDLIAIAFVCETRLLKLVEDEVEAFAIKGFELGQQTLFCGNVSQDLLLQAVPNGIRLVSVGQGGAISQWSPEGEGASCLTLVTVNGTQIVCSSGAILFYLEVIEKELKLVAKKQLEFEASCINISPLSEERSKFCAVSVWKDISLSLLKLPDLESTFYDKFGGDLIARSLISARFDAVNYLFMAIGDGSLLYYTFDEDSGKLADKKKVILGTQPTILRSFHSNGLLNIFACSDRPAVIYSSNNKLVFSNVNLKEVQHMCPLNASSYNNALVLTTSLGLTIGQIDQIQKLHIRSVPLCETPMRICYQEDSHTFAVLTIRQDRINENGQMVPVYSDTASQLAQQLTYSAMSPRAAGKLSRSDANEIDVHHLLIVDQTTFEVTHAHQFLPNEHAISITSARLGDDQSSYFIVGTAFLLAEEPEPTMGRLIVFRLVDGKLVQIHEKDISGAPYVVHNFNGKLLAAVNSTVRLFEWTAKSKELNIESSYFNNIVAYRLKTKGDFIIVGDLMRSVSLLAYKSIGGNIDKIAGSRDLTWLTEMNFIDDDAFIVADSDHNLFVLQKDFTAVRDVDQQTLKQVGCFHLADYVEVMRNGSLVMSMPCNESSVPILNKPIIFGCTSGALGIVVQISKQYYDFLSVLQHNLLKLIKPLGNVDYTAFREFSADKRTTPAANFIDGDVIESFLDLSRDDMKKCLQDLQLEVNGVMRRANVEDIIKVVEELSRIH